MNEFVAWIVVGLFAVATGALAVYGLHLYVLLLLFRRRAKEVRANQRTLVEAYHNSTADRVWPVVTSQIPLYNEMDVADRIIRSVAALDYAPGKHEIQVLDDSDDQSDAIVDRVVADLRAKGVDIKIIRRENRIGFKAGALAKGQWQARGEYLCIFDADFVPPKSFLRQAIPLIAESPDLACLQGRWTHLNLDESWLTRAQGLGIDGHFAVEQGARAWNGLMMNFNGTAGIWRKKAIEDPAVGGWQGDTLTEDLDLSYRAQLAGWRIDYCFDLACPAELPGDINAFKSQQRRWATGSMQVAVKLLPRIWRSPLTLGQRIEATLHLTHYSVAVWMLILALVARPMLMVWMGDRPLGAWFWGLWGAILLSAVAPATVYGYARWVLGGGWSGVRLVPNLIALGCGMCANNSLAVLKGLTTCGGEFVRTPKSGNQRERHRRSSYSPVQTHLWAVEIALGFYSLFSFFYYLRSDRWAVSVFLLIYGVGFLTVGWMSRPVRAEAADTAGVASGTPLAEAVRT